jgi:hypothetical protein
MDMYVAETARCADCYTVAFTDEMRRCATGHWTCPACVCDCEADERIRAGIPSWLQSQVLQMQARREL